MAALLGFIESEVTACFFDDSDAVFGLVIEGFKDLECAKSFVDLGGCGIGGVGRSENEVRLGFVFGVALVFWMSCESTGKLGRGYDF